MPMKYWDPLGLGKTDDAADFRRRRTAEIKNGRVAMWACMGFIVPEYYRWPGYLSPSQGIKFTDLPSGVAALYKMPAEGWAQIGIFIGFLELFPLRQEPDRAPGDAPGCGKLGVPWFFVAGKPGTVCDPVANERSLNAELNNGRLAMVAITGMVAQNGFLGTTGPEMWLPSSAQVTARAFENELGVQPPTGFWDPLGFTSDGDAKEFYRRRCVEIKHGRVSMIACIGYIVPEYFKFPGYISPSIGLKFSDIPHGLAALLKVPAVGWTQVVFFGLAMELFAAYQNPKLPPGKLSSRLVVGLTEIKDWPNNYTFGPYGIINAPSIADPEVRKTKLNAEIANGRLAMFAIMAMMFQNGTVGTTGPEMWLPPAAEERKEDPTRAPGDYTRAGVFGYPDGSTMTDPEEKRHRLNAEIGNGRLAMTAMAGADPRAPDGAPSAKRRRTLPPGDGAADHLEHVFIPFPRCDAVMIKELFSNDKVAFIRAGVATGKSTIVKYLGATSTDFIVVNAGGDEATWVEQLVESANEQLGTEISKADKNPVPTVVKAAARSNKILVFDEAHTLFSSPMLVDKILKAVVRPRVLFLSAASEARSPTGELFSTPPQVRRKYIARLSWPAAPTPDATGGTPDAPAAPEPELPPLRDQLAEASIQLTTEAVEFFARFCGGIRGIFVEAMRWVQVQQSVKPGEWDLAHAVAVARDSCGQESWEGGLLQAMAESRAIHANGRFSDARSLPEEFVSVLVGGPRSDLRADVKKEMAVGGLILPERGGAYGQAAAEVTASGAASTKAFEHQAAQREFLAYNWGAHTAKFGVANYLMATYHRHVLRKERNLQVRVRLDAIAPSCCADLLVKALPYMGFQCVVAPAGFKAEGELHSPLSAAGLPCEPHYSGAAAGALRDLEYDAGSSESSELGKADLLVTVRDVLHCLEWVMAARGPAEHERHRGRFDSAEYSGAKARAIVTVGNDQKQVMERVKGTRSDGVEIIGVVASAAHDSYLVLVKPADGGAGEVHGPFFVECDCVARSLKKNAAGRFELVCCQELVHIDRGDSRRAAAGEQAGIELSPVFKDLDIPAKFLQKLLDKVVKKHDAEDGARVLRQLGYKVVNRQVEEYFACVRDGFKEEAAVPTAGPPSGFTVSLTKEGEAAKELKFTGPGQTGPQFCAMTEVRLRQLFGAKNPLVDALLRFRSTSE